jgi:hypothetical protein
MTDLSMAAPAANPNLRAGAAALAVLIMTSIHHVYGAVIYDTPFRLHIVFISVPVGMAIAAALYVGATREDWAGRIATWIGITIILAFAVAAIGFFEGGYNHVVKNIVYFTGGEEAMMKLVPEWLYDPAAVEIPNDFIFEATGIAQFPLGVLTMVLTWRLARRTMG